jgi:uncharacterized protein YjbI with pentapeptide repeats
LSGADLTLAGLKDTNLTGADQKDANFTGANLTGTIGILSKEERLAAEAKLLAEIKKCHSFF